MGKPSRIPKKTSASYAARKKSKKAKAASAAPFDEPPVALFDEVVHPMTKDSSKTFKLRSTPEDEKSPSFEQAARVIKGGETPWETIQHGKQFKQICAGQNLKSGIAQYRLAQMLYADQPLTIFEASIQSDLALINSTKNAGKEKPSASTSGKADTGETSPARTRQATKKKEAEEKEESGSSSSSSEESDEEESTAKATETELDMVDLTSDDDKITIPMVHKAMLAVRTHLLPQHCLYRQQAFMRHGVYKPKDHSVKELELALHHHNNLLKEMPPYQRSNMLTGREIVEILWRAIPQSWHQECLKRDFNIYQHEDTSELVRICQLLELAEGFEKPTPNSKKAKSKSDNDNNQTDNNSSGKGQKHCLYHGDNNTHDTSQCIVLKKLAKQKKDKDSGAPKPNGKPKSSGGSFSKKELHILRQIIKAQASSVSSNTTGMNTAPNMEEDSSIESVHVNERMPAANHNPFECPGITEITMKQANLKISDGMMDEADNASVSTAEQEWPPADYIDEFSV